jgi:hypothetical protein
MDSYEDEQAERLRPPESITDDPAANCALHGLAACGYATNGRAERAYDCRYTAPGRRRRPTDRSLGIWRGGHR